MDKAGKSELGGNEAWIQLRGFLFSVLICFNVVYGAQSQVIKGMTMLAACIPIITRNWRPVETETLRIERRLMK